MSYDPRMRDSYNGSRSKVLTYKQYVEAFKPIEASSRIRPQKEQVTKNLVDKYDRKMGKL